MNYPVSGHYAAGPAGNWTIRLAFVGASMLLYCGSLTQAALYTDKPADGGAFPALLLLLGGWLGLFAGVLAWLANPLLAFTWALLIPRRTRFVALLCAVASLGFAVSFLGQDEIMTDEGGTQSRITAYGPGYWLWTASIATALTGCLVAVIEGSTSRLNQR